MAVLMVPETHVSQKMVIKAKRKEMERFKRVKVYRVVTRESMDRDEEGNVISTKREKEEKLGTWAQISALISGLHGVDVAEDDEVSSGGLKRNVKRRTDLRR